MKTIPLTAVHVAENRQRRNFDLKSLSDLAESIKARGLLHPIVLRDEGERKVLVSGERRLRAITDIFELGDGFRYDNQEVPKGEIPYVDLGELDEIAREEAELDENIKRADLSWQERAAATARLSALRGKQAAAQGLPAPRVADIARELRPAFTEGLADGQLGVHAETTRREIIVAKHLADPEVKGAKDVNEAFKILKRKEDTAKRVELAATVGRTFTAAAHTLLNEDAVAWMATQPAEQFDVILTDPPYGMGADEFGDSGGMAAGAHAYKDDYDTWKRISVALARDGFRLAKPQAHLYCFCDIDRFHELKEILSNEGWNCFRTPIVWHKPNGNRTPWVDFGPQRKYELVLYANKGKKPVTRIYPDVVSYTADENIGHHAQKPVALFVDLLRRSVASGDRVLDICCGSGPIFPAAHELKVAATGLELDPAAYALAMGRIKVLHDAPELAGL